LLVAVGLRAGNINDGSNTAQITNVIAPLVLCLNFCFAVDGGGGQVIGSGARWLLDGSLFGSH